MDGPDVAGDAVAMIEFGALQAYESGDLAPQSPFMRREAGGPGLT